MSAMTPHRSLRLAVALSVVASRADAVGIGAEGDPLSVEVHAFASQGFILSKDNNYIDAASSRGSFQLSEIGVNLTKTVGERLRFGVQLFAQDFGTSSNYNAKMDWFYADYRFADWLGLRFGRLKIPFGLNNEINDVDSARTFVLLPQSVYPIANRNYLLAQTGGELYGYLRIGAAGALDYRAYGGTIFFETTTQAGSQTQVASLNVPFVIGGRLLWEAPLDGLRLGGSVQALRLDADLLVQTMLVNAKIPATLVVGSVEYAAHDLLLAAEYSRWYVKLDSSNPALFRATPLQTSERAYGLVSYRLAKWLQPGAYYSLYFPNTDNRSGRANVQHDIATTLRFDITPHWLVKLEGHYMAGTAGLTSSLNSNTPTSQLERFWGVFLAKTTVYF